MAELAKAASQVAGEVPGARPLAVGEILRWPGVLAEPSVAPEELSAQARRLVGEALAEEGQSTELSFDELQALED